MQILHKLYFRHRAKRLLRYFYRWKLHTQLTEKIYKRYVQKTLKCRYLFKLVADRQVKRAKDAFHLWHFLTVQGLPFYHDLSPGERRLQAVIHKIKAAIEANLGHRVAFGVADLYETLEVITAAPQRALDRSKNAAIRRMRCLFEVEKTVVQSQQGLLVRTISVNLELYNKILGRSSRSSLNTDIGPKELLSLLEHAYQQPEFKLPEAATYGERYRDRLQCMRGKPRDSELLVTGMWASGRPLFHLREYIFVKLLQRTYIKWMSVAVLKLRFNKHLGQLKDEQRAKLERRNNRLRKTWARIILAFVIQAKVQKISSDTLIAFEFAKKAAEMQTKQPELELMAVGHKAISLADQPEYEDYLREAFRKQLQEVKRSFASKFMFIMLRPDSKAKDVRRDLANHLMDALFQTTCGALSSVNNSPRDKLMLD